MDNFPYLDSATSKGYNPLIRAQKLSKIGAFRKLTQRPFI